MENIINVLKSVYKYIELSISGAIAKIKAMIKFMLVNHKIVKLISYVNNHGLSSNAIYLNKEYLEIDSDYDYACAYLTVTGMKYGIHSSDPLYVARNKAKENLNYLNGIIANYNVSAL